MNGAILENYVVAEIAKSYLNSGVEPYMYYYRDKDAKEIDVVLEHDGSLNPIEIKKTANPRSELTRVFSVLDRASVPRGNGAILCMKTTLGAIDRNILIVPVWMIYHEGTPCQRLNDESLAGCFKAYIYFGE